MDWRKVLIMIPALNPPQELVEYIQELIHIGFLNILVVDDGSDPSYRPIFNDIKERLSCMVMRHAVNLGKGRAIKTGINYYLNLPEDMRKAGMITVDSDGQHMVKDVKSVAEELCKHNKSLILGCRDFSKNTTADIPWKSSFGNRTTTIVFKLLFGKYISDTQTGLRGIPECIMPALMELDGERFEYETNMLIYAVKNQIPLREVGISTIYVDNNAETHFHPLRDSYKIYRLMFATFFRYTLSSLSSFLIDIALFQIFILLLFNVEAGLRISCATVAARVCSSLFNYFVNRIFVFQQTTGNYSNIIRYYSLCIVQMMLSAIVVYGIYTICPISETVIKIIVDSILFLFSFQIQQKWVFRR